MAKQRQSVNKNNIEHETDMAQLYADGGPLAEID